MADRPAARAVDKTVALRDELRQWRLALGWWSGLPAQEAFDFWKQHQSGKASTTHTTTED